VMRRPDRRVQLAALGLKTTGLAVGILAIALSMGYAFDELTHLAGTGIYGVGDVVAILSVVSLTLAGTALVAQLPESLKARFSRMPTVAQSQPVYGFGTMVAVGVGATLGSPLFILIPLNVEQYEVISVLSLLLATILSVAMAKLYSDFGKESKRLGVDLVGGPSFARLASGARSVRYFVSRVSMWVANTALAAYTQIAFLVFDSIYMPKLLAAYGLSPEVSSAVTYVIGGAFVAWTLINILFEKKYLRALGRIQVVLTGILILIMIYHAGVLGGSGGWNFGGFFAVPGGAAWLPALVVNTGYLYLLFFGFQEIQVMERDSIQRSPIPVVSWIKKGYTMDRTRYFSMAMVVSVVVAATVNIFYALAVYSAHTNLVDCASGCIPALYLALNTLGANQGLFIGVAFLIASMTTFVPAFLAASRHLGALGEDGYMPSSLARLSWVFTIVAVFLMAIGDQNFLVELTDIMVLISLGIIALSGIWLRRRRGSEFGGGALSLTVGLACFLFGGALYFNPGGGSVVVFGAVAVMFAYLIFDIIELGSLGAQLFLSVFGLVCAAALSTFDHALYINGVVAQLVQADPNGFLVWSLLACSLLLVANVIVDVKVLGRTSVK
jgi:amino acid transporter